MWFTKTGDNCTVWRVVLNVENLTPICHLTHSALYPPPLTPQHTSSPPSSTWRFGTVCCPLLTHHRFTPHSAHPFPPPIGYNLYAPARYFWSQPLAGRFGAIRKRSAVMFSWCCWVYFSRNILFWCQFLLFCFRVFWMHDFLIYVWASFCSSYADFEPLITLLRELFGNIFVQ